MLDVSRHVAGRDSVSSKDDIPLSFTNGHQPLFVMRAKQTSSGAWKSKTMADYSRVKAFICLGSESEVVGILPIVQHEFETTGEMQWLIIRGPSVFKELPFARVDEASKTTSEVLAFAKFVCGDAVLLPCPSDDSIPVEHRHPSHQFDQWDRAGLLHLWNTMPLTLPRTPNLALFESPAILIADDESFPVQHRTDLGIMLAETFPSHQIVRLSDISLPQLNDWLALYDAADLIICAETFHLPLTRATKTPVIAIANDQPTPWHGSAPAKRFAYFTHYGQFHRSKAALIEAAKKAISPPAEPEKKEPSVAMVYIHFPGDPNHVELAKRFVGSYLKFHPGVPHRTIVVCQSGRPTDEMKALFKQLPNCSFFTHDDSGWDIGAFIAVSRIVSDDVMVCMGGTAYIQRGGWMKRMVDAWKKHGPGLYGSLATYEISPHINTSGFWCTPELLSEYPLRVRTKAERYDFEHGPNALWKMCLAKGVKVMLATWDGEYEWAEWRKPKNIYRSGDQTNCLTLFRHSERYSLASPEIQHEMTRLSDTITDPKFIELKAA